MGLASEAQVRSVQEGDAGREQTEGKREDKRHKLAHLNKGENPDTWLKPPPGWGLKAEAQFFLPPLKKNKALPRWLMFFF